jgi:hypothetical protein
MPEQLWMSAYQRKCSQHVSPQSRPSRTSYDTDVTPSDQVHTVETLRVGEVMSVGVEIQEHREGSLPQGLDSGLNRSHLWRCRRDHEREREMRTHSFRKSLATLIDDEGLSARIGADHLGHTNVSMTQDKYMSRGRVHTQVAELLNRFFSESDGQTHGQSC